MVLTQKKWPGFLGRKRADLNDERNALTDSGKAQDENNPGSLLPKIQFDGEAPEPNGLERDDAMKPPPNDKANNARESEKEAGAKFAGQPAFETIFFSNFFRKMLRANYKKDLEVYNFVTKRVHDAVGADTRYSIYRKFAYLFGLLVILFAATEHSPLAPLFTSLEGQFSSLADPTTSYIISAVIVFVLSFGLILWMGHDYDKTMDNIQKGITGDITGICGKFYNHAQDCLDAIFSRAADKSMHNDDYREGWPEEAKRQFLKGYASAKRLQYLEMYTFLEARKAYLSLLIMDRISIAIYVVMSAIAIAVAYFAGISMSVPTEMVAATIIVFTLIWLFVGAKSVDSFPEALVNSLDDWHSYGKFGLKDRMGEIIRKDQIRIIELQGALAPRR